MLTIGNCIKDGLLGVAVGDALGVPVEFLPRESLLQAPLKGMQGFGTHHQPPGTWSDDSSLTFCTAESLCLGYSLRDIAQRMVKWRKEAYWTAHNEVFDIGGTTSRRLHRLDTLLAMPSHLLPVPENEAEEYEAGNGSLMRILPLAFYLRHEPDMQNRWQTVKDVSALTHAHPHALIGCFLYVELAIQLLERLDLEASWNEVQQSAGAFIAKLGLPATSLEPFSRLLNGHIGRLPEEQIQSSGYVLHTLEASLWCLFNTENYLEAVLKAVNLGDDTDTTAAVTGGLAGILYGAEDIPEEWLQVLARKDDIEDLADRMRAGLAFNRRPVSAV